ncbi:MAG: nuclear transport factor 2 family protein [Hymenobacteraceae bacterium]|nr:nuclear transport factor 2 family protein [Hymenobacteraceae bacterium]MDX5396431.1 nuclear transport factor 2 family protein [Hymenobacteraceae bacterium]MDX5442577.1 nuclear transport factor 2 family protein [Hymenobacteraceae bacterium]MDX5512492.1 nuclear transport factor 2 family protein [Hymenobacteraceae bacterium]
MRTAREVLEDHLELSKKGSVEEDLKRNYAEDVVMLTSFGTHKGYEGMKRLAQLLEEQVPDMTFDYKYFTVEGEVGFLLWSADSKNTFIDDGADSYVVRNGRIVAQTIYYTVKQKDKSGPGK